VDSSDKSATASPSLYLEVWCSLQYHGDNHLRHLLSTPHLAFRSTSGRIRLVLLLPTVPRSALLVSCPSTGDTITTHYAAEYLSLPSQLTAHQPAILGRQALTTAYVTLPPDAALLEQLPLLSRCALRCRSTSGLFPWWTLQCLLATRHAVRVLGYAARRKCTKGDRCPSWLPLRMQRSPR